MNEQRVLVTGGAGFIGSELVRHLVAEGAGVIVLDNLVNGKPENLQGLDCQLEVVDIRSESVPQHLQGVDTVYHLACLGVRHSIHSPMENHLVNAEATLNLLLAARAAGVSRFVYVSSSEVYGTARTIPMTEEHPTFPMTVYGASKLAGECYTRAFWETYQYPTVVVRPFNTFGPRSHHEGDSGEVIPKFLLRLMAGKSPIVFGDGKQTRDFTFVSDTARGILLAGKSPHSIGQTINIGSNRELSMLELAREAKAVTSRHDIEVQHAPARPGDVLRLYADVTKAREILGFEPEVSFQEGLEKLLQWYQGLDDSPSVLLQSEVEKNWEPAAT